MLSKITKHILYQVGKNWDQAKALVSAALNDLHKAGSKDRNMVVQLEGEMLELDHLASADADLVEVDGQEEITSRTLAALAGDQANIPSLATSCIVFLLNAGDWDSVTRLSHANMPYIVAARNSAHATVFQLARNLAFLMHNLRGNNLPIVKKFGKDVWDSLSHLCSSAAGKRKEGGGLAARERALVSNFLGRCWNLMAIHLEVVKNYPFQSHPTQPACFGALPPRLPAQRCQGRPRHRRLFSTCCCLANWVGEQCISARTPDRGVALPRAGQRHGRPPPGRHHAQDESRPTVCSWETQRCTQPIS